MGSTLSSLRDRLFGGRSRSRAPEVEYSEEAIKKKFDNMPKLTTEEKIVLKSSWKVIKRKILAVSPSATSLNVCTVHCLWVSFSLGFPSP